MQEIVPDAEECDVTPIVIGTSFIFKNPVQKMINHPEGLINSKARVFCTAGLWRENIWRAPQ